MGTKESTYFSLMKGMDGYKRDLLFWKPEPSLPVACELDFESFLDTKSLLASWHSFLVLELMKKGPLASFRFLRSRRSSFAFLQGGFSLSGPAPEEMQR